MMNERSLKAYWYPFQTNDFDSIKIAVAGNKGLDVKGVDNLAEPYILRKAQISIANNKLNIHPIGFFLSTNYRSNFSIVLSWNILDFTTNKKDLAYTVLNEYHSTTLHFQILALWWQNQWAQLFPIILAIVAIALLIYVIMFYRAKETNKELAQKNALLHLENKLHLCRLKPHFIFNALTPIQTFILQDKKQEALIYFEQFSKLMRSSIAQFSKELTTIEEELRFLESYTFIQQQRRPELFSFEYFLIGINKSERILIPSMILQPIIENAIAHCIVINKAVMNKIILQIVKETTCLRVEISNTGRPMPSLFVPEPNHGLGILDQRLKLINKIYKMGSIHFEHHKGITTFTLILPLINE